MIGKGATPSFFAIANYNYTLTPEAVELHLLLEVKQTLMALKLLQILLVKINQMLQRNRLSKAYLIRL